MYFSLNYKETDTLFAVVNMQDEMKKNRLFILISILKELTAYLQKMSIKFNIFLFVQ